MGKHNKYTLILLAFLCLATAISSLSTEEVDEVCDKEGNILIKQGGVWKCHNPHVYGEMWNYTSNATAWDFEFPEGDGVYHNLSNLSAGTINGFECDENTTEEGGSYLTVIYTGYYKITWAISLSSDDNKDLYGFMVAKDFNKNTARECYTRRDFTARNKVGSASGTCIFYLTQGQTINLLIENEVDNDGLNIHTANFNAHKIGD